MRMSTITSDSRQFLDYRQFLVDELQKRQTRNPAYSLRAFSRDLGIGSSRLSEIINAKVGLSEARALQIAEKLQWSEEEKSIFVDLVQYQHARSIIAKRAAQKRLRDRGIHVRGTHKNHIVPDWCCLALLELLKSHDQDSDGHELAGVLAKRLGVLAEDVHMAMQKLEKHGHLVREGNKWTLKEPESISAHEFSAEAFQQFHLQILDKAQQALEKKSQHKIDFSSIVVGLNSQQLVYAKDRINEFRRNLIQELDEMSPKDGVYCLSIQLFELTEDRVESGHAPTQSPDQAPD